MGLSATPDPPTPDTREWLPPGMPPRLGPYRLTRPLVRGGMGMVFEARHELLDQPVAVKVIRADLARDPHFVSRFRREITSLGRIPPHPNLVRALFAGEDGGVLFLVMEFVEGTDLDKLLLARGPLHTPDACEAIRQAANGLDAIHRAGVVHRDLKPSNLMLAADGTVKVLDLGLARPAGPAADELTPSHTLLGTFDYQAPEQADDPRHVDIRADLYSLGCALYRLLTGNAPYGHLSSAARKIHAHAHLPFPAVPGVPPGLEAVLARLTAKAPADRYPTPAEAAAALRPFAAGARLEALLEGVPGPNEAPDATPELPCETPLSEAATVPEHRPRSGRRGLILAGVASGMLLALAGGVAYWARSDEKPQPGEGPRPGPAAPADPIDAAGAAPRDLDGLTAYQRHDLLASAPVQALWDRADGTASRTYDPARRLLIVQSPANALFHLGTTQAASYTLEVEIRQARWQTGAGVYLGYRQEGGGPTFQFLRFAERAAGRLRRQMTLERGIAQLRPLRAGWSLHLADKGTADIPVPVQDGYLILDVVIGRLARVRFNGVELPTLIDKEVNDAFTPADHRGALGVMCVNNSSTFTQAPFTLKPDR